MLFHNDKPRRELPIQRCAPVLSDCLAWDIYTHQPDRVVAYDITELLDQLDPVDSHSARMKTSGRQTPSRSE